ncbi:L-ornithine N(5)-monooxygenase [Psilocybe cubensis]|uniref:L-ornithine N(5)-monooxygenase n=1 Tax=Psilocybe cubensis TaxID=181762 RepID=A0ACB8H9L6_PSICU|nr:L-ornithine N(5)-monooxygenase [Psilocybe cubensis]KAH9484357.1 L-ornithine N(5)-monooxygenase [Psilocybe cubensis]
MPATPSQETVLDLVGLGFGPANIAIAGALTEQWAAEQDGVPFPVKNVLFIEKYTHFRWHPGMLLPDAKMQISFMKDLATLRNPKSPYTFLSYLHSQGRLVSFINRGSTIPSRKEYSDYLSWASSQVQANGVKVLFGHEIIAIDDSPENTIAIRYRNLATGEESVVRAKNIVIAPGGDPKVPSVLAHIANHPHALHSSDYATSISKILETVSGTSRPLRVAVIGSGQSAAEVTMDLRNRLNNIPSTSRHQVDMLIRKGALKPSDDSPFANEIFDPVSTDAHFSTSSRQLREMKLAEYKLTNYGVVNPRTLENLYEIIYGQRLDADITHRLGDQGVRDALINIKPYTFISEIKVEGSSKDAPDAGLLLSSDMKAQVDGTKPVFSIRTQNVIDLTEEEVKYDAIVYATGYERRTWVNLLKHSDIAVHFGLDLLTSEVRLLPAVDIFHSVQPPITMSSQSESGISSPTTTVSAHSSPPTSPEMDTFYSQGSKRSKCQEVFISRNYRLLPTRLVDGKADYFAPGVYLQGCEESTHGLSDTLLSVMGVRAGEVVRDLAHLNYKSK